MSRGAAKQGFEKSPEGRQQQGKTADRARLELAEPVPGEIAPLLLATTPPAPGLPIAIAGYNQDRAQLLIVDLSCHVIRAFGDPDGGKLIVHDCAATRGTSGAPLLVRQESGWAVLGINIAASRGNNLALAISGIAR